MHGSGGPQVSLQCRRFHRAHANGFNRESAMLKLPKRGGNGASQGEGGGGFFFCPHAYRQG